MSKKVIVRNLLKNAREKKELLIREVAMLMEIDQALVSKWESGNRKPTREQILKLASILEIDTKTLLVKWISEKIIFEYGMDETVLEALMVCEDEIEYGIKKNKIDIDKIVNDCIIEIDELKATLSKIRHLDSYRIAQALELEYTFESNRIEGNTLTLKETDLVINEGITISGKSMREHLEAINHKDAVEYLKHLIERTSDFKERDILQLHNLVLRGIDSENAGKYRTVQVMIKGSSHLPPAPYLVAKQMEDLFFWYEINKKKLHPVLLAAEMSERLVTIHPFIDGNGRTSRLLMNLILLKNGYVIANIKGDNKTRLQYYNALEEVQTNTNKNPFIAFIANVQLDGLKGI